MNILFVLPEYYPHSGGGISTYYQHYIKAIRPHCQRIKVMVGSGYVQGTDKFEHEGIEIEYLNPALYQEHLARFDKFTLLPEYRNNIAAAWAMWQQANQGKGFDVIECTDFGLGYVPWLIQHDKPVITRLHGSAGQIALHENNSDTVPGINANIHTELALLPLSDKIITHSRANQQFWSAVLNDTDIKYLPPVYCPVMPPPLSLSERDNYGLVTARIQKWKGPEELCKAVGELKTPVPLKWYGRDVAYDKVLTTNEYLQLSYPDIWCKLIEVKKPVNHHDVLAMQRKAKFGIVPSVWDMFNFTCAELMAAGTPVICADGAGAAELIENGHNGYTYNTNDTHALAECIIKMNSLTESEFNKMAAAAQQTIEEKLNNAELIEAYMNEYALILENFTPSNTNVFLRYIYSPGNESQTLEEVLNKQPLKKLVQYLLKRIKGKYRQ
ncbi:MULTISPECIES: glycosyltransferase family 4 protein [unclassified Mucilaginibacter]|uniref:glycosyltransferase family 4 protein n=1 Tax=unclassified Mucilaginibacter TaxID=2617802 RepID=UPI0009623B9C|nr:MULTISPECIES: glycosyltransferase family 4 protein [unclassified Mucilaginibacter]OJW15061.1 MAG: hypothetical protein BGO48_12940 [Mucilaginibacter sp. 44-25]PLW89679.1 MAG: hypothetical protein C0154_10400 [Mucilaginibacter sp.]PMP65175.1 MAG: hypothetical protein C0191_04370 [Mucilaginibacter sp.]HEK21145.1 glycosyltransferase [Bacteroidota bacterium]